MVDLKHYRVDATLLDGGTVRIRAIRPDDKQRLLDGFHRLSEQSVYFRFFEPKRELNKKELVYFTEVDFIRHVALVAALPDNGDERIVGMGRYSVLDRPPLAQRAEVTFTVVDEHQGRGIGTLLFEHLVLIAGNRGILRFEANVLAKNHQMLEVFEHSGLKLQRSFIGSEIVHISFPILMHVTIL